MGCDCLCACVCVWLIKDMFYSVAAFYRVQWDVLCVCAVVVRRCMMCSPVFGLFFVFGDVCRTNHINSVLPEPNERYMSPTHTQKSFPKHNTRAKKHTEPQLPPHTLHTHSVTRAHTCTYTLHQRTHTHTHCTNARTHTHCTITQQLTRAN